MGHTKVNHHTNPITPLSPCASWLGPVRKSHFMLTPECYLTLFNQTLLEQIVNQNQIILFNTNDTVSRVCLDEVSKTSWFTGKGGRVCVVERHLS